MKRRQFLRMTVGSGALAATHLSEAQTGASMLPPTILNSGPLVEKVKWTMLTMQRDAWEQGVAAQALLEMGEAELVIRMAKEAVVRQDANGRLAVISCWEGVTDPAANGEAVLFAAKAGGDQRLRRAGERMLEYLLERAPRRPDGTLYHVAGKKQVWVDSMYMAPPFLAVAGQPREAVRQVEGMRRLLYDPEKRLFSHIWDDSTRQFFRKDCWGVGNGWAAAGMTRVAEALPADMAVEKKRVAGYTKDVIEGCLEHQREDGLFHDIVDNPDTFVETNLAQMLAYSIFRGVVKEWLPKSYLEHARRMREAVRKKVDDLGFVQGVCGSPRFDSPGTATEGQAFFLLMETAAQRAG